MPHLEDPIPAHETDAHLVELHGLMADRYAPSAAGRTATDKRGRPVGALDKAADRWTLCGGAMRICQDHPRKWTLEDAISDAICLANRLDLYGGDHPLTGLYMWETTPGGRSHEEVMALLTTTLKARQIPLAA